MLKTNTNYKLNIVYVIVIILIENILLISHNTNVFKKIYKKYNFLFLNLSIYLKFILFQRKDPKKFKIKRNIQLK